MDELGMIVAMLDEEPSAHGEQDGRRRLTFATTGSPAPRLRASTRPRFALFGGFGLAGAAAAVTAGAVLLSSGTTPRAPDHDDASSASRLMLAAAHSAERESVQPHGRYWEIQTQVGGRMVEDGKSYNFVQRKGKYDAGPGKDAWGTQKMVSKKYFGPTSDQGSRTAMMNSFTWTKESWTPGEMYEILPGSRYPGDVRKIPGTPAGAKTYLDGVLKKSGFPTEPGQWAFTNAPAVLAAPVGPQVRAAVYRLLATAPGLRLVGKVKDPLGRSGTAFSLRGKGGGMVYDYQLIIDTKAGRVLADRTVLVKTGPAWADKKAGDVINYSAVLSYGWTDKVPAYPPLPNDAPSPKK
ncbi:CU044_5270 family protein [Actinomadura harenae]|uniref:CU044_5270 family protein n=1 Tax=Actinomadura harenae TaxID=2483351 RepID=A0A3M2MEC9_9ACTN|nr:CU044_5270 family protein [Actinomadura harenae]RMI47350.1 hypothetical protein EBO15_02180 [Actinomadura harenae]